MDTKSSEQLRKLTARLKKIEAKAGELSQVLGSNQDEAEWNRILELLDVIFETADTETDNGNEIHKMESCHLCKAGITKVCHKVVIKHWCPGSVENFPEGFLVLEKGSIKEAVAEWNSRAKFFKRQDRVEKFIDGKVIELKVKDGGQHDN